MKLLCKLVTNPLKPRACAYPINLCNTLGSGLSDLHHCIGCGRGPWLESVINFPFLPVALSWRSSLFPLGDSDIVHNNTRPAPPCAHCWSREQSTYPLSAAAHGNQALQCICLPLLTHLSQVTLLCPSIVSEGRIHADTIFCCFIPM